MSTLSNITEAGATPPLRLTEEAMAELKAGPRRRAPTHPGRILASAIDDANLSVRQVAIAIGVTAAALGNVVGGKSAISADMALRLGTYFGNGPELWLGLQTDYDLWQARMTLDTKLKAIKPLASA